ncbi:unnamed protein product [Chrysoparadoxa australica]
MRRDRPSPRAISRARTPLQHEPSQLSFIAELKGSEGEAFSYDNVLRTPRGGGGGNITPKAQAQIEVLAKQLEDLNASPRLSCRRSGLYEDMTERREGKVNIDVVMSKLNEKTGRTPPEFTLSSPPPRRPHVSGQKSPLHEAVYDGKVHKTKKLLLGEAPASPPPQPETQKTQEKSSEPSKVRAREGRLCSKVVRAAWGRVSSPPCLPEPGGKRKSECIDAPSEAKPSDLHPLINAKDEEGSTPLHVAALAECSKIPRVLISQGADVNAVNSKGSTPLHWAATIGNREMVQMLLHEGADVNAKDQDGRTALHGACAHSFAKISALLVNSGSDVAAKAQDGSTPLHLAAGQGSKDIAAMLVKHGAPLEAVMRDGRIPLHAAAQRGFACGAKVKATGVLPCLNCYSFLAHLWCLFSTTHPRVSYLFDQSCTSSTHIGSHQPGHASLAKKLLDWGSSYGAPDGRGHTPLYLAQLNGHRDVVYMLALHMEATLHDEAVLATSISKAAEMPVEQMPKHLAPLLTHVLDGKPTQLKAWKSLLGMLQEKVSEIEAHNNAHSSLPKRRRLSKEQTENLVEAKMGVNGATLTKQLSELQEAQVNKAEEDAGTGGATTAPVTPRTPLAKIFVAGESGH